MRGRPRRARLHFSTSITTLHDRGHDRAAAPRSAFRSTGCSHLFFAGSRSGLRAIDLGLEARGHLRVAERRGQLDALLKHLDRARYVALAEQGPGFAEDASIALAFFGGIHEDY